MGTGNRRNVQVVVQHQRSMRELIEISDKQEETMLVQNLMKAAMVVGLALSLTSFNGGMLARHGQPEPGDDRGDDGLEIGDDHGADRSQDAYIARRGQPEPGDDRGDDGPEIGDDHGADRSQDAYVAQLTA